MNRYNLGAYLGIGKEVTPGTAVPVTAYLTLASLPEIREDVPMVEIPGFSQMGLEDATTGTRTATVTIKAQVTPKGIGYLLAGLLGSPTTTAGSGAGKFVHKFRAGAAQPSYTVEGGDGVGVHTASGVKWGEITLEHSPDGILSVSASGMGMKKESDPGGAGTVPVLETTYFLAKSATITLDGAAISAKVEQLSVKVSLGKEALKGMGTDGAAGVDITGEADLTVSMTLRFDGTDRSGAYRAATGKTLGIVWSLDADTSLELNIPQAVLTADPNVRSNDALGLARVALEYRAKNWGLIDVLTVKNTQPTY